MEVIKKISQLRKKLKQIKAQGKTIGFVPTMGYLHQGHLSLMQAAREQSDFVVISIFVNPTQFGPNEDFLSYPRDFRRDKKLAQQVGVDVIFYPSVEEMYPQPYLSYVEVKELDAHLCGAKRPGHFRGVCSVVAKLFNIVQPDIAYFGQKDIQQARIIQQMVRDLNFPVKIKIMPIVREKDGLAMSSRNTYLSQNQRKEAVVLYKSLLLAKGLIKKGLLNTSDIISAMEKEIKKTSGKIDYVEVVDYDSLKPIKQLKRGQKIIVAVAVWFGKARLIDNIIVKVR